MDCYLFVRSNTLACCIVAKSVKISTGQFFTKKISTKNARFTTFPNLRQNCVNAFEIKYFYTQCLFLTSFLFNHPHHCTHFNSFFEKFLIKFLINTGAGNTGVATTGASSTGATGNVLQAPILETHC